MEETIKYFQPDITDIRVGYECEIQDYKERWECTKAKDDMWGDFAALIDSNKIRVPYLTKEQIEAEGWVETDSRSVFKKDKWNLGYAQPLDSSPLIWIKNSEDYVYQGECKDINTFRYICKLINIK